MASSPSTKSAKVTKNEAMEKDFTAFQSPHEASVERLVRAVDLAYHHPWRMAFRAFFYGFFTAVGAAVGTVAIGALSVYLFNLYGGVQLILPFVEEIRDALIPSEIRNIAPSFSTDFQFQNFSFPEEQNMGGSEYNTRL